MVFSLSSALHLHGHIWRYRHGPPPEQISPVRNPWWTGEFLILKLYPLPAWYVTYPQRPTPWTSSWTSMYGAIWIRSQQYVGESVHSLHRSSLVCLVPRAGPHGHPRLKMSWVRGHATSLRDETPSSVYRIPAVHSMGDRAGKFLRW